MKFAREDLAAICYKECPDTEILEEKCGQKHKTKKHFDWGEQAQPIHWIIAALIAEVRKEEEGEVSLCQR